MESYEDVMVCHFMCCCINVLWQFMDCHTWGKMSVDWPMACPNNQISVFLDGWVNGWLNWYEYDPLALDNHWSGPILARNVCSAHAACNRKCRYSSVLAECCILLLTLAVGSYCLLVYPYVSLVLRLIYTCLTLGVNPICNFVPMAYI